MEQPLAISLVVLFLQRVTEHLPEGYEEEEPVGMGVMLITFIVLSVLLVGFYSWLLANRFSFFKKAVATEGRIVAKITAKSKGSSPSAIPIISAMVGSRKTSVSGYMITVAYDTDEATYETKGSKLYSNVEIGDTLPVHYLPDDPYECAIDRQYEVNPALAYGMISGGVLLILTLLGLLLFVIE